MNRKYEMHIKRIKIILIYAIFCMLSIINSLVHAESYSDGFALVLSGGGARGLAHIGVLKAFEESDLRPEFIVATSVGAIIGGLYSAGLSADSIEMLAKSTNWEDIFKNTASRKKMFVSKKSNHDNHILELRFTNKFKPILPNSLSHGQAFYNLLAPVLAPVQYITDMDFDNLPIPIRIISTDLISGKKIVLHNGNLATAIRASCAIPLTFSPVQLDSLLLIDGGLTSNIPVLTAKENGYNFVVVVDVTSPILSESDLDNPVRLVDQIISIGTKGLKQKELELANVVIKPDLKNHSNTNFYAIDSMIVLGYNAAKEKIEEIKFGSGNIKILQDNNFSNKSLTDTIKGIQVYGNDITSSRFIKTAADINVGDSISDSLIQKSLSLVYSLDLFNNVNIDIDSNQVARILIEEKKYWRSRMGLRFDEFHLGELYIEPAYENIFGLGINGILHLQYGMRREKYSLEFQGNHLFTNNLANYVKLKFYISNERIFKREIHEAVTLSSGPDTLFLKESNLRKTGLISLIGTQLGRSVLLSGGIKIEKYKVQQSEAGTFENMMGLSFNDGLTLFLGKLTIDNTDQYPFPTSGIKSQFTLSGTSKVLGGPTNFIKINGDFGQYLSIGSNHTFFYQLRFAWTNSSLPDVERTYLGGVLYNDQNSDINVYNYVPFTGLRPRSLSGDHLWMIHLDYRFRIEKNLYAELIADYGHAWNNNVFDFKTAPQEFYKQAPVGIGAGIVYRSYLGPIRIVFGQLINNLNKFGINSESQIYFSAGHDF